MPVSSHSTFCQYLLDMSPLDEEFLVDNLPFVGRNKVIYRTVTSMTCTSNISAVSSAKCWCCAMNDNVKRLAWRINRGLEFPASCAD